MTFERGDDRATRAAGLEVRGVSFSYGPKRVLRDVSVRAERGSIHGVMGPSGCGKSTLLRLICGLEAVDAGVVHIAGSEVSSVARHVAPARRRVGVVFQDLALFPHLSVERNVGFALRSLGRRARRQAVAHWLDIVDLAGESRAMPHTLSGGQQQRVALARALAAQPEVLLMDEPFTALDASLREQVRGRVCDVLRRAGVTSIVVTHDAHDAVACADDVTYLTPTGRVREGIDRSDRTACGPCGGDSSDAGCGEVAIESPYLTPVTMGTDQVRSR